MNEWKIVGGLRLLPRHLVAKKLGVSEKTLQGWKRRGRASPPMIQIGGKTFCDEASLASWIRAQEQVA
jgi:hypothetical protein